MKTECKHSETWTLVIDRAEEDDWPPMRPYSSSSYEMRPDRITAHLTRGHRGASVSVSGLRLRKDGTPGSLRAHRSFDHPAWVTELVNEARSKHNLTDEALTRPE